MSKTNVGDELLGLEEIPKGASLVNAMPLFQKVIGLTSEEDEILFSKLCIETYELTEELKQRNIHSGDKLDRFSRCINLLRRWTLFLIRFDLMSVKLFSEESKPFAVLLRYPNKYFILLPSLLLGAALNIWTLAHVTKALNGALTLDPVCRIVVVRYVDEKETSPEAMFFLRQEPLA